MGQSEEQFAASTQEIPEKIGNLKVNNPSSSSGNESRQNLFERLF